MLDYSKFVFLIILDVLHGIFSIFNLFHSSWRWELNIPFSGCLSTLEILHSRTFYRDKCSTKNNLYKVCLFFFSCLRQYTDGKISGSQENSYGLQWDVYIETLGISHASDIFSASLRALLQFFSWSMVIICVITSLYMDSTVLLVEVLNLIFFYTS